MHVLVKRQRKEGGKNGRRVKGQGIMNYAKK
jgi:hypothetical protein